MRSGRVPRPCSITLLKCIPLGDAKLVPLGRLLQEQFWRTVCFFWILDISFTLAGKLNYGLELGLPSPRPYFSPPRSQRLEKGLCVFCVFCTFLTLASLILPRDRGTDQLSTTIIILSSTIAEKLAFTFCSLPSVFRPRLYPLWSIDLMGLIGRRVLLFSTGISRVVGFLKHRIP